MLIKKLALVMSALLPSISSVAAQSSGTLTSISGSSSIASAASSASSLAASATPKVHRVNVGPNGFMYEPNTTYADVGDIVRFVFYPTNHSVIRAEWTGSDRCGSSGCNPCVPYEIIHQGQGGFHSGNIKTQDVPDPQIINGTAKSWDYTVETADPVFFYCNALGSCHPNGMVGVINPNELVSLAKQKEAAIKAPYMLAPGEPWPAEGVAPGAESVSTSSSANATDTAANNNGNKSGHHSLSGGAIAGIVIAGVVVIALAAALFYFMGRNKTYKDMFKEKQPETAAPLPQNGDADTWKSAPPTQGTSSTGYPDHRMSHMTQYSQTPSDATFVGYNRQTGAPEFAAEAPISEHGVYQYGDTHGSPQIQQGGFPQNKRDTFELPASTPETPHAYEKG